MGQQFLKQIKELISDLDRTSDRGAHGPLKEALDLMIKDIEDYSVCADCGSRNVRSIEDRDIYICDNCDFEWRCGEV
jgi:ribosomal protein L37AE/L43A